MRKSLVSIIALGLFAGAPVMAQTTTGEATTNATQQQTTQQQTGTQQQGTFSDQQFQEMLSGYEERSDLEGRIARAMTADGDDVFVLVGPRDLDPDGTFETQDSDVRDRFEGAGFTGVQDLGNARMARANLDEDHYIFAFSADQIARPGMQTGGLTDETGTDDTQVGGMNQSTLDQSDLEQSNSETTTQMGTQMGQTDTEMDLEPETGTTGTDVGDDDAQVGGLDSDTETELGQTGTDSELGQTGTVIGEDTQLGQMGTDADTELGQTGTGTSEDTQLGQMGTDTETDLGQTGTGTGEDTQLGQMGTDTDTELGQTGTGTGTGEDTQLGQMDTDTETEMGQTDTDIGEETQVGQMDADTETETGQIGRALSGADADRMVSDIEGAGIQNADQFQGRVVRATSNGSPVFFLITSRDMSAEVDISEDEVRQKLQEANLQDIEFVDDVAFVRGDFDDDSVFVLAGDLMGRGMQQ